MDHDKFRKEFWNYCRFPSNFWKIPNKFASHCIPHSEPHKNHYSLILSKRRSKSCKFLPAFLCSLSIFKNGQIFSTLIFVRICAKIYAFIVWEVCPKDESTRKFMGEETRLSEEDKAVLKSSCSSGSRAAKKRTLLTSCGSMQRIEGGRKRMWTSSTRDLGARWITERSLWKRYQSSQVSDSVRLMVRINGIVLACESLHSNSRPHLHNWTNALFNYHIFFCRRLLVGPSRECSFQSFTPFIFHF